MDFVDSAGTRYQLAEAIETPAPAKKSVVWPWVVGGLALAGSLVWIASLSTRRLNPVAPTTEALILEARDPATPWTRLLELVKHPKAEVRRAILDNPNVCHVNDQGKLDTDLLEELVQQFPEEVASHPLFVLHALIEPTQEMLWVVRAVVKKTADVRLIDHVFRMWGTSSVDVREAVAKNPSTPMDLLRLLGNETTESNEDVRRTVASNPSTPEDTLRILGNEATESHEWVRESVAWNPSTPVDILLRLGNEATESNRWVREAVAKNPRTPVDLLRTLANPATESAEFVREAAQKALAARGLA